MKKGFSLIELLISLIIISIVMLVSAPIFTKKIKQQNTLNAQNNFKTDCIENCLFCKNNSVCSQCKDGYQLKNNICTLKGEIYCEQFNAIYDKINNVCITKYNIGDKELSIKGSVSVVNYNQTCAQDINGKCCWRGNISTGCNSNNSNYNGCYRTVCNWQAAREICKNFSSSANKEYWRLPTQHEIARWANDFNFVLKTNMCSLQNSQKLPQCNLVHGVCRYADGNICGALPSNIWSDLNNPNNSAWAFYVEKEDDCGINSGDSIFNARSVRCVKNIE